MMDRKDIEYLERNIRLKRFFYNNKKSINYALWVAMILLLVLYSVFYYVDNIIGVIVVNHIFPVVCLFCLCTNFDIGITNIAKLVIVCILALSIMLISFLNPAIWKVLNEGDQASQDRGGYPYWWSVLSLNGGSLFIYVGEMYRRHITKKGKKEWVNFE